MTSLENHQIKGLTIKSALVTLFSTISIVASVTTTYYNIKAEIQKTRADQETQTRLTNLRLTILENQVALLQKEINSIKFPAENSRPHAGDTAQGNQHLLTAVK